MTNSKQDPQELTLGQLLGKVCRLVGGRMRMKLEGIGLHHAQGMILFHLWHKDGIAQNILAQALHITPPTTTNTLQRMERDGWIERRRDATDQRVVQVYLTKKAGALRQEARASLRELDQELTSVLTENERGILMTSLLKVRCHLSMQACDRPCARQENSGDVGKENQ
ncbi:MAG: MarR family winged helix-turn-helix transcriptional regulator [Desulfatiglandaceae bacterium]